MVQQREEFRETQITKLDLDRLVFLDETWVKTNMTRLYGWGPSDQRLIEKVPHGHWQTTTFVGAMRSTGLVAPLVVDGAINGDIFRAYVQQFLVKELKPNDVVIMDNLSCHKISGIEKAIEEVGASVLYLPPYSPELNPIENLFSKFKSEMRKRKPRTKPECDRLCGECTEWFAPTECKNYIQHAGYRSQGGD